MKTIKETINLYEFKELSENAKDKARENFHIDGCLGDFMLEERLSTLKKLAEEIGGKLDYSISLTPDRGEYIQIKDYDKNVLRELCKKKDDCPLTGCCYDIDVLELAIKHCYKLDDALHYYLNQIHEEYEYYLTDEYLTENCEANEYCFTENGKFYS